jgi:hypothetical protein
MHIEVARHSGIDRVQELSELGRAMPLMKLRDQLARFHVERGKQRRGAMPPIVVRPTLDLPGPHRQHGLRAIQRLNLRLLVHPEHERGSVMTRPEHNDLFARGDASGILCVAFWGP